MIEYIELHTFYKVIDPRDGLPFYIGQTTTPYERLRAHQIGLPHSKALSKRRTELDALGLQTTVEPLEQRECTQTEALEREIYWIQFHKSQGITLLNVVNNKRERKAQMFYLPLELSKWLKQYAFDHEREISDVVEDALKLYLDRKEAQIKTG